MMQLLFKIEFQKLGFSYTPGKKLKVFLRALIEEKKCGPMLLEE